MPLRQPDNRPDHSEAFANAAMREGTLTFPLSIAVMPSRQAELEAEGERCWRERWGCPTPPDWSDRDRIEYALKARLTERGRKS